MNKKSQMLIIVSLLILIIIIVFGVYLFYNIWNSAGVTNNVTNNDVVLVNDKLGVTGVVTQIVNGNTIVVDGKNVVLLCVKIQKQGEYYYNEEIQYLTGLLLNKEVVLQNDKNNLGDIDTNNLIYRYVWLNGGLVNQNIVKNGYAKSDEMYSQSPTCQAIMQSESIARVSNVGLWKVN